MSDMTFTNEESLFGFINTQLSSGLMDVMAHFQTLLEVTISNEVYAVYSPKVYNRTEEFLNAWTYSIRPDGLSSELFYDPNLVNWIPSEYQHGNEEESRADNLPFYIQKGYQYDFPSNREESEEGSLEDEDYDIIVKILNETSSEPTIQKGKITKWYDDPRDFWTPFLEQIESPATATDIKTMYDKYGLDLIVLSATESDRWNKLTARQTSFYI